MKMAITFFCFHSRKLSSVTFVKLEPRAARWNIRENKDYAQSKNLAVLNKTSSPSSRYLSLNEVLQWDIFTLLLLLLVLLEHKAGRQGVPVVTRLTIRTLPEPAVLAVLHSIEEELAYLQHITHQHTLRNISVTHHTSARIKRSLQSYNNHWQ